MSLAGPGRARLGARGVLRFQSSDRKQPKPSTLRRRATKWRTEPPPPRVAAPIVLSPVPAVGADRPCRCRRRLPGEYESADLVASTRTYRLPDLALFDPPQAQVVDDSNRAHVLEDTLASFGVGAKVMHIERGPSITRYELKPERGIKISKIASLADDLALALAATSVRIEAPIPGKSAVGIEIPNSNGVDRGDPRDSRSDAEPRNGSAALDGARQRHHRPPGLRRPRARCRICSSPARPARANPSA